YADDPTEIGYAYYVYPYAYTPYEYPDDWDGESTTLTSGHDLLTGMPSVNGAEYTQLIRQSGSYANSDVAYSSKNPAIDGGVNYFGISNPFNSKMTVAKSDDNSIKNLVQGGTVYILNAYDGTWSNNINSEVEINGAQGFFAASQQEELNLILSYADKTIKSAAQNAPQSKSYQEDDASELITFEVRANNTLSKAYARVNSSAEDGFDKSDAYSLFALDNDKLAEPYFLVDNEKLLKNEFKSLPFVCALNFKVSNPAEVSLTVENANKDIEVSIIDAENDNRETVLGSNPFDFTAIQGDNEGRFFVKFSKKNVGTEVVDAAENNITIRNENKNIYINGKGLKNVVVMNATGQIIYSSPVVGESHSFYLNAEAGLYLVKAVSECGGKTAKIVVD
ncbi:MAG: T9SS type A sorting domain-containing protein, partial [Bacteroidales bacterium]|nr:T9SS type A sorting domain-containing protein [Bacteroidales bacterium]